MFSANRNLPEVAVEAEVVAEEPAAEESAEAVDGEDPFAI
jgi:hypothetical protein